MQLVETEKEKVACGGVVNKLISVTKKISEDTPIGKTAGGFSGEGGAVGLYPGSA